MLIRQRLEKKEAGLRFHNGTVRLSGAILKRRERRKERKKKKEKKERIANTRNLFM